MNLQDLQIFLSTETAPTETRFQKIVQSCFSKNAHVVVQAAPLRAQAYWSAQAFGLDQVTSFQALTESAQATVLAQASDDLIRESCFIEMAGLSYTAKMSLESSNLEERLFYATMSAEEAVHFQLLRPFASEALLAKGPDDFTALIGEMIATAPRQHVIFLIQVLLEGWGLTHFNWMAQTTNNSQLRETFKTILKDEARHHAAGTALVSSPVTTGDKQIIEWLEMIFAATGCGPVRLATALQNVAGNRASINKTFNELGAHALTQAKLSRITDLIRDHVTPQVLSHLEAKNLLRPSF